MKQLVCPVSDERINERLTRLNALFAVLLTTSAFLFDSSVFLVILLADFYLRAFTTGKYSPVSLTSIFLTNALRLPEKQINKAPKIFAARLGFLMTLIITTLFLTGLKTAAVGVGSLLVFFAALEFVFGICMGCIIYTYIVLPFYKSQ